MVLVDVLSRLHPLGREYRRRNTVRLRQRRRLHLRVELPRAQLWDLRCLGDGRQRRHPILPRRHTTPRGSGLVSRPRTELGGDIAGIVGGGDYSDSVRVLSVWREDQAEECTDYGDEGERDEAGTEEDESGGEEGADGRVDEDTG